MKNCSEKLQALQHKILHTDQKIKIMIIGLGSVGVYLLDYLVSLADHRLEIIAVGRNADKMQMDVNIIRTAATIRGQLRSNIIIDTCNLENVNSIADVLSRHQPDFIVNSSRVYAGLKYGSISWSNLRAYGIWTPLSVKFARNIMLAYQKADCSAISINTSYSDAVIPWLKASGLPHFDFGSGNLNHLIPRIKFYIAEKFGIKNLNDIDVTLAVSHFHDVVISKEGHAEGQDILLDIKYQGNTLQFDKAELLKACSIAMPVDQKRNMMNASSNFNIIDSILKALKNRERIKIHTPGVFGMIGGYPVIIDGTSQAEAYIDQSVFTLDQMVDANCKSIYLDGIKSVEGGKLEYTPELLRKVQEKFNVSLPTGFTLDESPEIAQLIIDQIITPNLA